MALIQATLHLGDRRWPVSHWQSHEAFSEAYTVALTLPGADLDLPWAAPACFEVSINGHVLRFDGEIARCERVWSAQTGATGHSQLQLVSRLTRLAHDRASRCWVDTPWAALVAERAQALQLAERLTVVVPPARLAPAFPAPAYWWQRPEETSWQLLRRASAGYGYYWLGDPARDHWQLRQTAGDSQQAQPVLWKVSAQDRDHFWHWQPATLRAIPAVRLTQINLSAPNAPWLAEVPGQIGLVQRLNPGAVSPAHLAALAAWEQAAIACGVRTVTITGADASLVLNQVICFTGAGPYPEGDWRVIAKQVQGHNPTLVGELAQAQAGPVGQVTYTLLPAGQAYHDPLCKPPQPPTYARGTIAAGHAYPHLDHRGRQRVHFSTTAATAASPALRSATPYVGAAGAVTGQATGWHFPLRRGTNVILSQLHDQPEQAFIVGFDCSSGQYGAKACQSVSLKWTPNWL